MLFRDIDRHILNLIFALVLYVIVLGTAVASILSQPIPRQRKRFWLLVVCLVPAVGMLAYLPFSLEDPKAIKTRLQEIFSWREKKRR